MQSSIFGDTYQGVVSPNVFHKHPYPTRYHGMNLTVPRFPMTYVENPYAVPSFMGEEDLSLTVPSITFGEAAIVGVGTALVGSAVGYGISKSNRGKNALIGALVGGLVGYAADVLYRKSSKPAAETPAASSTSNPAPTATAGLGSSCGCSKAARAGGTAADLSALGRW